MTGGEAFLLAAAIIACGVLAVTGAAGDLLETTRGVFGVGDDLRCGTRTCAVAVVAAVLAS